MPQNSSRKEFDETEGANPRGGLALTGRDVDVVSAIEEEGLPPVALYLILSVPLIIFEEQIDCMPSWCGKVAIPPTLPFLFIEMLVLGGIVSWRHVKSALHVTLVFSIYGVLFEILVGGLSGAPLLIIALLGPYVAVGYAFISMLPLTILVEEEAVLVGGRSALPDPASSSIFHSVQF